jgi:hypothetical protein
VKKQKNPDKKPLFLRHDRHFDLGNGDPQHQFSPACTLLRNNSCSTFASPGNARLTLGGVLVQRQVRSASIRGKRRLQAALPNRELAPLDASPRGCAATAPSVRAHWSAVRL